ncbi:MAG: general secretion pathway protein GspL [Burkholderiales bacterium PBB1]|nr:MAG: general secretion pathway protein GspL [Burkholderiales bacterium PBB1]
MSILVISLSPRLRLRSRHADGAAPGGSSAENEFEYLLSRDGFTPVSQGRSAAALLPKADSVIAVVGDSDIAWHRITLPKAPSARLRAALTGVLEEALLDDADATHLALAPNATAGQPTWVAAVNRHWLRGELAELERHRVFVDRVVPAVWPDSPPSGHFTAAQGEASVHGSGAPQDVLLTWSHEDGVAVLRLQGGLARALLPAELPADARWTATPEVATTAERWLAAPVAVVSAGERALQATRTLWNLRQFDLAARHRGTRAARDAWRRWLSPGWRPVRMGLLALLVVQLLGLNLWAWHLRSELDSQRQAMVSLLQATFPQVSAVLDAPLQMQREVDTLRATAGRPSATDVEPMLLAAAAAWPPSQPPVDSLRYESGRLTLSATGWSDAEVTQFRSQLQPAGWQVDAADGRVSLSPAAGPTP